MASKKARGKRRAAEPKRKAAGRNQADLSFPLLVLLRLEDHTARILGWEKAVARRGDVIRAMQLTEDSWTSYPPGAGELLVSYYDAEWNLIDTGAMWARPDYFAEVWNPQMGRLSGGQAYPGQDDRLVYLSPPPSTTYVLFFRSRVESDPGSKKGRARGKGSWGRVRLFLIPMAAYVLPGRRPGEEIVPDNIPLPVPGLLHLHFWPAILAFPFPGWRLNRISEAPKGWIDSQETLHGDRNQVAGRFNIVITGDGFNKNEQALLDQRAKLLARGILATEPFHGLAGQINIHLVRVVSHDSGITRCTGTTDCQASIYPSRATYFDVQGCWPAASSSSGGSSSWLSSAWWQCVPTKPGYMGVNRVGAVYDAGSTFAPPSLVDLYIVLANVPLAVGSAFRSQKVALLGIDPTHLVEIGLHESAHVVSDIMEEYISPLPWDGSTGHKNVVDAAGAMNAPWLQLASAAELQQGRFRYVFDCPDPSSPTCSSPYNQQSTLLPGNLGLYWGAQFIDANENPCAMNLAKWDGFTNQKGRNFFRPMATCRMRTLYRDYCRACKAALRAAILAP